MNGKRGELILHKAEHAIAEEHCCSLAEVRAVFDQHPLATLNDPVTSHVMGRKLGQCREWMGAALICRRQRATRRRHQGVCTHSAHHTWDIQTMAGVPNGYAISPRPNPMAGRYDATALRLSVGTFHGAKALSVCCRIGASSGKWRNNTVLMLLLLIQSIPA